MIGEIFWNYKFKQDWILQAKQDISTDIWIWPFKVTRAQTDYAIQSATYDFPLVLYTNYSAISHGNLVFQQMTLIWPFEVT